MVSVASLAVVYLVGGLTFLPLCIALVAAAVFYSSPKVVVPSKTGIPSLSDKQGDDAEPHTVYRAGWLTVRRTYEPMKEGNGDGTYAGMLASSYRSFMDQRSRDPRRSKPKDRFFAVLKQRTLFLYESEEQAECWAAIDVVAHDVVIYPEGNVDGELYVKRTAIELKPRRLPSEAVGDGDEAADSPVIGEPRSESAAYDALTGKPLPWFLFVKVNSDKEDWYHSLMLSSRLGGPESDTVIAKDRALFEPADMARLMEQIDQQPDSIPTRWFNAILGRVFLSAYRTSTLEDYLTSRIVRKLKRVKTPAMLSEIQVREVNVGASVPLFSKPMLKELTPDGDTSMEVHVAYVGEARVTIETQATVSLGSRFKPYVVRLVLAVVLRELEGTLLVQMKPPPSNRVWFGFREIPRMALSVEPVVSTRQIKWSLVTGPIESRIRELIAESLVLPHMDDLSFFDTRAAPLARGGIYGPFLRRERPSQEEELNAPPRPDREVGPAAEDGPEQLVPAVVDAGSSGSSSGENGTARQRRPEARRRRSSEGDRPLDLTPMAQSPAPASSTPTLASKTSIGPSASSSTSVASLASGLSASLASWREKNSSSSTLATTGSAGSSSTTAGTSGVGQDASTGVRPSTTSRRKGSWFSKSGSVTSLAGAGAAGRTGAGLSTDSLASNHTATTISSGGAATADTGTPQEEVSAAKLRELLQRRAESREREKERERRAALQEEEEEQVKEAGEGKEAGTKEASIRTEEPRSKHAPVKSRSRTMSNLSRTAPVEPEKETVLGSTLPVRTDSPVPFDEPQGTTQKAGPAALSPPALPSRPSWIKPATGPLAASSEATGSTTSTASVPPPDTPSSSLAPSAIPPPPIRRHSPSASVDSHSAATTLLSAWRTRATDKEALAAGVASAKESMRRWGANWAAKRAQGGAAAAADASGAGAAPGEGGAGGRDWDRPIGDDAEGPTGAAAPVLRSGRGAGEREAYREHRARATSPAAAAAAAAVPRTPPRAIIPPAATTTTATGGGSPGGSGFRPGSSSLPIVQVSPSNAVSMSPKRVPAPAAPGPGQGAGYRPVQMMALPGIKDEEKRRKVRDDHLGGGARAVSAAALPGTSGDAQTVGEADKASGVVGPDRTTSETSAVETQHGEALDQAKSANASPSEAESARAGPSGWTISHTPAEASTVDSASTGAESPAAVEGATLSSVASSPPKSGKIEENPGSTFMPSTPPRSASPLMLNASELPTTRTEVVEASPPPPLPPRKDGNGVQPTLPARPTEKREPPPLPPRSEGGASPVRKVEEQVDQDELADEAGWGLDDSLGDATEERSEGASAKQ